MSEAKEPHLTPRSLVGQQFAGDVFGGIRMALIGYCPPPKALGDYRPQRVKDQHFIHVAPDSVRISSVGHPRLAMAFAGTTDGLDYPAGAAWSWIGHGGIVLAPPLLPARHQHLAGISAQALHCRQRFLPRLRARLFFGMAGHFFACQTLPSRSTLRRAARGRIAL